MATPMVMDGKLSPDTDLSKDSAPPRYTVHDSSHTGAPDDNSVPPPYHLERIRVPIGGMIPKEPFVTVYQLKIHLGLLRAFKELKDRVTDLEANTDVRNELPPLAQELGPQERWAWFLELALERFHRWVSNLSTLLQSNRSLHNPPIDVWLIWHAYMLNPSRYAEDLCRMQHLRILRTLAISPIGMLEIMGNVSDYRPQSDIVHSWETATGLPWDPIDCCAVHTRRELMCPNCGVLVVAPYLTPGKTGLAQEAFTCVCGTCQFVVTRESIAVSKFVNDLTKDPKNLDDVGRFGDAVYLPGTLFTRFTRARNLDKPKAKLIKASIYASKNFCYHLDGRHKLSEDRYTKATDTVAWASKIKEFVEYRLDLLTRELGRHLRAPMLRRVMSAYTDDRPYSLELVSAAQRQGVFVNKMHDLGWSRPCFFDSGEDEVALKHCIARYYAFLDLISSSPHSFFVPTLDIDLAWHTHQLLPERYLDNCVSFVGRFVNHDDKVEEGHLSSSFDITCRAWKQRFGVPYIHCGCPLPGDTIGGKLSWLSGSFFPQGKSPIMLPNRDDSLLATHPSDHNAVYVRNITHREREQRVLKTRKRKERDLKLKIREVDHEVNGHNQQHGLAFLLPVPLYYGYGDPSGIPCGPDGGCAAGGCGGGVSGGGCNSMGSGCGGAGYGGWGVTSSGGGGRGGCGSGGCGGGCGGCGGG